MQRSSNRPCTWGGGALFIIEMMMAVALLGACGTKTERMTPREASALTNGGDPHRGRDAMRRYGCNACHTIEGVPGANGKVGPPLDGVGGRVYIAGVLSNTPTNLIHWIQDPPAVDSLTAMPNLGVSERDARDMAAYLYSLQ